MFPKLNLATSESGATAVIRVQVDYDLKGTFSGTVCAAKAKVELVPAGEAPRVGEGSGESAFGYNSNAGRNCEIATLQAIPQALDQALSKM